MVNERTPVVLIADDEPSMLALVAQHIRTMGYEVIEASDGEQAWALAKEHLPDLVVLDVMMPGMSGWDVCRKIREEVALAHTGVVMLTGIGENLNEMTSPLFGADAYIDKPFQFPELDEKVRATLAQRTSEPGLPGLARTEPEAVKEQQRAPARTKSTKKAVASSKKKAAKRKVAKKMPVKAKAKPVKKAAPKAKTAKKVAAKTKPAKKAAPKATPKKVAAKAKPTAKKAAPKTTAKKAAPKAAAKKAAPKAAKKTAKKPAQSAEKPKSRTSKR